MKVRLSEATANLLIDALVATLFTVSFTAAGLIFSGLDAPLVQLLLISGGWMVLISLLSRRWWLAPLTILSLLAAILIIIWRLDVWTEVRQTADTFYQASILYLQSGDGMDRWLPLLHAMILLPACVLIFLIVRMVSHLFVFLSLTAIIYLPLLIIHSGAWPPLLIALAALLIMMPRHFSLMIERERPKDTRLPRAPMQLLAIPVVIISLLLAQAIVPEDTMKWRWHPLADRYRDLEDLWRGATGYQRYQPIFGLDRYGYPDAGRTLGGPVELGDQLVLRVRTETPVLLRGNSRSLYTGTSWQSTPLRGYRFNSPAWRSLRRQAWTSLVPSDRQAGPMRQTYGQSLQMEIELGQSMSHLFSAGRVQSVQTENPLDNPAYFKPSGDLYTYERLPRFSGYVVEAVYYDRNQSGFSEAMRQLATSDAPEQDRYLSEIRENYLQLPETLPLTVTDQAMQIAGDAGHDYEKAVALESYFKENGRYQLDPAPVPEGQDFVEHVLETQTGYCVYFATAMTVMARTLGIPSRYVEGFYLERPADSSFYEARGYTAHAWAELYFAGFGWLPFDATPAAEIPDIPDDPIDQPVTPTPVISPPLPDITPPGADGTGDRIVGRRLLLILILLIAVPLLLRFLISLAYRHHRTRFLPENVHLRWPDPRKRLEFYYRDLLHQLSCLKLEPENDETMRRFAARADLFIRLPDVHLSVVLETVGRWRYGGIVPDEAAIAQLAVLHDHLERRIRQSLSAPSYFFRRVLRRPRPADLQPRMK